VSWYSPSIYDIYFNDDYVDNNTKNNDINDNDDVINYVFTDKLEIMCKKNIESTQQKKKLLI